MYQKKFYQSLLNARINDQNILAILLDPDKFEWEKRELILQKIKNANCDCILIGGSKVETDILEEMLLFLKEKTKIPLILFPGDVSQISMLADGILFLNLISGNNPEYLIGQQIKAAPLLINSKLEIISTGYILIDGGKETAVQRVSNTKPIDANNPELILATAQASELIGHRCIYLEAGSGAKKHVPESILTLVSEQTNLPIIVGGGIRDKQTISKCFEAGATMVVIGTAFEDDINFFN